MLFLRPQYAEQGSDSFSRKINVTKSVEKVSTVWCDKILINKYDCCQNRVIMISDKVVSSC